MKTLIVLSFLIFLPFLGASQKMNKDSQAKRAMFVYWGYNRSFYTDSKISFFGPGYDFSLAGVQATDRPSPDFITYVDPSTLTVPQFNARIGFNFKKKMGAFFWIRPHEICYSTWTKIFIIWKNKSLN